ncbi:MAG: peptide chain release factor N(5)-glutamine methyltransferase [Gammaproteobacteria bacterium]
MNRARPTATASALLAEARARLAEPREAVILVAHALGLPREVLYAHPEREIPPAVAESALALIARRIAGEPVAYLTGAREFYGLALAITPAALIPRPETELVVELALACVEKLVAPRIADVGTGSGAIALALAHARLDACITASDRSAAALGVAARNARALALENISLVRADALAAFAPQAFDLIVSNPPYVAAGDPHLDEGDLRFEPPAALVAGADGLAVIRRLITDASVHLKPGGTLILEHGADQQPAIRRLLAERGYVDIEAHHDLADLPRAVAATRPEPL